MIRTNDGLYLNMLIELIILLMFTVIMNCLVYFILLLF